MLSYRKHACEKRVSENTSLNGNSFNLTTRVFSAARKNVLPDWQPAPNHQCTTVHKQAVYRLVSHDSILLRLPTVLLFSAQDDTAHIHTHTNGSSTQRMTLPCCRAALTRLKITLTGILFVYTNPHRGQEMNSILFVKTFVEPLIDGVQAIRKHRKKHRTVPCFILVRMSGFVKSQQVFFQP